jgi:hypothetical protein
VTLLGTIARQIDSFLSKIPGSSAQPKWYVYASKSNKMARRGEKMSGSPWSDIIETDSSPKFELTGGSEDIPTRKLELGDGTSVLAVPFLFADELRVEELKPLQLTKVKASNAPTEANVRILRNLFLFINAPMSFRSKVASRLWFATICLRVHRSHYLSTIRKGDLSD